MPSYFTLNSNTGQISVRASLTAEIRDSYQGRIVAFDGGSPPAALQQSPQSTSRGT